MLTGYACGSCAEHGSMTVSSVRWLDLFAVGRKQVDRGGSIHEPYYFGVVDPCFHFSSSISMYCFCNEFSAGTLTPVDIKL